MNAADYFDWWQFSATGLGATTPGALFKQLHHELSRAGANVVILREFLRHRPDTSDVGRWRRPRMLGLDNLQLKLTLDALEAIGARRVVDAFHEGKRLRAGRFGSGMSDLGELVNRDTETWDQVARLLDEYAETHRRELAEDVARHGDPRRAADFDPGRVLDELNRRSRRLASLRDQQGDLPRLLDKLERLRARIDAEPPDSPRVQQDRQRLMQEHQRYAQVAPDDLTAGLRAWLREVERLRDAHPDVFRPMPTRDESVNARLAAIGAFELDYRGNLPAISWSRPAGLECDWTSFDLNFIVSIAEKRPDPARVVAAYDALITAWERFRQRFPDLKPKLRQYILNVFRTDRADQLRQGERGDYEDEHGQITDETILANVEGAGVALIHHDHGGVELSVSFGVTWDDEHGSEVQFDADGEILDFTWDDEHGAEVQFDADDDIPRRS